MVCDMCGALVEATERGRVAHTAWHADAYDVIDVRERAEAETPAHR